MPNYATENMINDVLKIPANAKKDIFSDSFNKLVTKLVRMIDHYSKEMDWLVMISCRKESNFTFSHVHVYDCVFSNKNYTSSQLQPSQV
jgi:hypothetical protein